MVDGAYPNMLLERTKVGSWMELYGLDPEEALRRLDDAPEMPLHAGDTFLTVLNLRAVRDLHSATRALERGTESLRRLTVGLVALAAVSLVVAAASLIVALSA
jgi:hypothetical protein